MEIFLDASFLVGPGARQVVRGALQRPVCEHGSFLKKHTSDMQKKNKKKKPINQNFLINVQIFKPDVSLPSQLEFDCFLFL